MKRTEKELAEKYRKSVMTMDGFLDGINDSLKTANPIETMEEDTVVSLAFDKELLYKNMIDAKADWLYGLPQWDKHYQGIAHISLHSRIASETIHLGLPLIAYTVCLMT